MALSRRDYSLLAAGWDAAIKSMRYEDGTPVEIVTNQNPYTQFLEEESN
jgi:hypothetical protein